MSEKITAIYLRTSTNKQEKGYQAQLRALKEYCDRHNHKNVKVFGDEGVSGAKSKRPGLDEMLFLVKEAKVETVLVYSFSRMARSTKHLLDLLELFRESEVNFVSMTEQVDTSSNYGKLVYTIMAGVAELERSLIIERILCGHASAKAKGIPLGRKKERNFTLIRELLSTGRYTQTKIAKLAGTSRAGVWREIQAMKEERKTGNDEAL